MDNEILGRLATLAEQLAGVVARLDSLEGHARRAGVIPKPPPPPAPKKPERPSEAEAIQAFIKARGGMDAAAEVQANVFAFSDGSVVEVVKNASWNPAQGHVAQTGHRAILPPADEYDRLQLQARHHRTRQAQAERDFYDLRGVLLNTSSLPGWNWPARWGPEPMPRDGERSLRALSDIIAAHKGEAERLEQEAAETPRGREIREQRERTQAAELAEAGRRAREHQRIDAVTIP